MVFQTAFGKTKLKTVFIKWIPAFAGMTMIALLYTLTFTLFASPAFAASATSSAVPAASGQTPFDSSQGKQGLPLPATVSPTSPLYTDLLVNNLFHSFSCLAIGQSVIGQPCLTYQMTKNAQGAIQGVPVLSQVNTSGGVLGATGNLIGMLYQNPPVRTVDYLASVSGGFGVVKEANAQVFGSGAAVLNPILRLWQVSRNISYVIMIVVFVVIGLMIMFRNRINPQTVITAQAALPGLVIGLIMITFSYFFAGLISDIAFIGTNIVGYYFSAVRDQANTPQNLVEDVRTHNVLSLVASFTKVVDRHRVEDALGSIWNDLAAPSTNRWNPFDLDPQKAVSNLAMFIMTQFVLPFGGLIPGVGQAIVAGSTLTLTGIFPVQAASLALSFVAMLILVYAMLRLLMRLINNFITIIFLTISAPFQFLAASLPGRQGLTTNWILNMLANILAFPAVLAVLYFVAFILAGMGTGAPQQNLDRFCTQPCPFRVSELKPYDSTTAYAADPIKITDANNFPLLGCFNLGFINLLLAFGALVALPSVPDIIGRTIGRLGVAGQLIGQEIGSSVGRGQGYASRFQQGIGGMAGQIGQVTDQVGYLPDPNNPGRVVRITPGNVAGDTQRLYQSGWRAGLGTKIRSRFGL